jgi:hypothetical protein
MEMSQLAFNGMFTDIQLREKLIELLDFRKQLSDEEEIETNPIREQRLKDNIITLDELIGKIRYNSLDELEILSKTDNINEKEYEEKNKIEAES